MHLPFAASIRTHGLEKLRNLLQTWVFCLIIAGLQYAFQPAQAWIPLVAYSISIGTISWACIDLGRHYVPSAAETGWPTGLQALALMVGGLAAGYLGGNFLADLLCRSMGWYHNSPYPAPPMEPGRDILITLTSGLVGTYYFYSLYKGKYLQHKMQEAYHRATEARLKLLETQLEPHMLFNTLANLRALIALDPPRAQTMLDHMIDYLRATLDASRSQSGHTLHNEFARLQDYLALMAIRMGPRLQFTLSLPDDVRHHPVPALLLQPLVENSVQHGLEPKLTGGHITVAAERHGAMLVLRVEDSGLGLGKPPLAATPQTTQANTHPHPGGFGLQQVRDRLLTAFGPAGTLTLENRSGGGTCATITLPLHP